MHPNLKQVGRYTYGHQNLNIVTYGNDGDLYIGSFCSIAHDCTVILGGNHNPDWISTYPFGHIHQDQFPHHGHGHPQQARDTRIGHDVWIGRGATIMPGVEIGHGAIIAANSHIVKDVEPYQIVGGNPQKPIRYRHTAPVREWLLRKQWWHLTEQQIRQLAPYLCQPDFEQLKQHWPDETS